MAFVVELEPGVFLAPVEGDPGRTLLIHNATIFRTISSAKRLMLQAQAQRPFPDAQCVPVSIRLERL